MTWCFFCRYLRYLHQVLSASDLRGRVENAVPPGERPHPPRRNQVSRKGGKGTSGVGNTPGLLFLGVGLGCGWALCGCGGCFFFACLGSVHVISCGWSDGRNCLQDVNSQMKRHFLGESLSRQICHAARPVFFFLP